MEENDKKRLTEWLGLCWHEPRGASMSFNHGPSLQECRKCGEDVTPYVFGDPNRTFTDPQDFFACFEKLVEGGKWDDFDEYAYQIYCQETAGRIPSEDIRYNQWLLSRTESGHYRLCQLTAEYLKEKEKNNG
jgi:hypothetical protein